jgi:hypothetical protein
LRPVTDVFFLRFRCVAVVVVAVVMAALPVGMVIVLLVAEVDVAVPRRVVRDFLVGEYRMLVALRIVTKQTSPNATNKRRHNETKARH